MGASDEWRWHVGSRSPGVPDERNRVGRACFACSQGHGSAGWCGYSVSQPGQTQGEKQNNERVSVRVVEGPAQPHA